VPILIKPGESCLEKARVLLEEHPSWKLYKGPPEPRELFWPEDTAHFWTVDEKGLVHDPTAYRYPGYDYSKGQMVKTAASELPARTVLVTGVPGSGKTTLAHQLAHERHLPVIQLDLLKSSKGQLFSDTAALRKLLPTLKSPHVIEGAQILGLNPDELKDYELIVLEQPRDVLVQRLVDRGWTTEEGVQLRGPEHQAEAERLTDEMLGYLAEFRARAATAGRAEPLAKQASDPQMAPAPELPKPPEPLSRNEQQLDMWMKWQQSGKDEYMEQLLDSLQPIIKSNLTQYTASPIPYPVLQSQANIFVRDALKDYNPTKSALGTYATNSLMQMSRFVQKHQNVKYLPEYLSSEYGRMDDAERSMFSKLKREPTDAELAGHMGLPEDQVARIRLAKSPERLLSMEFDQDDVPISARVSKSHEDAAAYLRSALKGKERQAWDMMSSGETNSAAIASKLQIPVDSIYAYRRRWTNILRRSGML
jgi:DNA-directed RNA polymerase specialized sigma subunit